jgi:hypothetical protein
MFNSELGEYRRLREPIYRAPATIEQPVPRQSFASVRATVLKAFRYRGPSDSACREVQPGDVVTLTEPDYDDLVARRLIE